MSTKLAKNALEILLQLERTNEDCLDLLTVIAIETSSGYTVSATEELRHELVAYQDRETKRKSNPIPDNSLSHTEEAGNVPQSNEPHEDLCAAGEGRLS